MAAFVPSKKAESVQVVVRCRPMNKKEKKSNCTRIVHMDIKRGDIALHNPKARREEVPKTFTFDSIYDWNSRQQDLYDETFSPLVESVLQGYNGTIFAYGQTGTGKTWTMEGERSDPELRGVIPNSFKHIFDHINRSENEQYLVRASYLEIYQEDIRDLLSKDQKTRLELREKPDTGIYVKDLKAFVAKNSEEIERVMTVGNKNRSVGCTDMNEHSSRSHAIFIITVECSKVGEDGENHIHVGKLNLVDLAGSERQSKTGATGQTLKEATKINLSLSTLGNVISALVDGRNSHIPYRDSKLTRLLQDSLGGNARTVMVATMGPADYNYEESITTLRYANRAKNIKNKPKINEDPKDALLREYQDEINKLQAELSKRGSKTTRSGHRKRRRQRGPDGELLEDGEGSEEEGEEDEEEDDDEAGSRDPSAMLNEQQEKIEAEKKALMENKEMIAEEKDKLMVTLQSRSGQVVKEQARVKRLASTIEAMQGKLLVGDKTIAAHTEDQERALAVQRRQLAEEKRREREMQQQLEAKEETTAEVQETFATLKQEAAAKTKKLKALYAKYQRAQEELEDMESTFGTERSDMMQTLEDLTRDIGLKAQILENFVPEDVQHRILARAEWSDDRDEWMLAPLQRDPLESIVPRPMGPQGAKAGRSSLAPGDLRYRPENTLQLDLDMAVRTTREYEEPAVAPRLQAAVNAALHEGAEELVLDARAVTEAAKADAAMLSARRPKADKKKSKKPKETKGASAAAKPPKPVYPQARGLVSRQGHNF